MSPWSRKRANGFYDQRNGITLRDTGDWRALSDSLESLLRGLHVVRLTGAEPSPWWRRREVTLTRADGRRFVTPFILIAFLKGSPRGESPDTSCSSRG